MFEGVEDYNDFSFDGLRILGILSLERGASIQRLARAIGSSERAAAILRRGILESDSELIASTLENGLPVQFSSPVGGDFSCPECGYRLRTVPCITCCSQTPSNELPYAEDRDCGEPTRFPPGSPEKISVMAMRASRGFSVFSEEDEVDCSASLTPWISRITEKYEHQIPVQCHCPVDPLHPSRGRRKLQKSSDYD